MFIDIHAHAFKNGYPLIGGRQVFSRPEEIIERYDEVGIEKGALLPIVSPEVYLPQSNEEILEIAGMYPDRFFPFCNIDPRSISNSADAPFGDILRYYKDRGCKGLGEVMPNLRINDPMVQNLFRHAEDVGLPLTFDMMGVLGGMFGLYDEVGMPHLEQSLQRFPDLIIMGHSTAFWSEIGRLRTPADRSVIMRPNWDCPGGLPDYPIDEEGAVPHLMRRYSNLYGDLSGPCGANALSRDRAYGIQFLNEFQDRLFFGADICPPDMPLDTANYLLELRDSGEISEQVFNKVARENAMKLYQL